VTSTVSCDVIIDIDEHFEKPVSHRFLHGCLKDDPETRFTMLLPDPHLYRGRLVQFLEGGMGGNEYIGPQDLGYYVIQRYGAAYVKSNHGHVGDDLSKIGFEGLEKIAHLSNYRTVLCAREILNDFYGKYPDYTYALGGSGGGLRTTILMENYPEIYDGAVAIVQAETSIPTYYFSLFSRYHPVLRSKFDEIVDATDVGGTGDPYAVLDTEEQKDALRKLYNAGFPRGAEMQMNNPILYYLSVLFQELLALSPERVYYQDFWVKKGYAGYEGEVADQIVEGIEGEVVKVYTMREMLAHIAPKFSPEASQPLTIGPDLSKRSIPSLPPELMEKTVGFEGTGRFNPDELSGYTVTFKTGRLSGKSFHISRNIGNIIFISSITSGYPEGIKVGDKYVLDNKDLLAWRHYHRHIITLIEETYRPPDFLCDGNPIYPQRASKVKEILKMKHFQTGDFKGKMITIFAAHDVAVWPPVLFNYLDLVKKRKGHLLDDYYRFYLVENATHGPPMSVEESFRTVSFSPMIGRALDYLIEWVERNIAPPPSTKAELSSENSLIMPHTAAERRGIQPIITKITADGQTGVAKVPLCKPVKFNGIAEAPVGNIIKYEWYCQDLRDFYHEVRLKEPKVKVNTPYTYTFQQPGKYFAVLRVTSDLGGNPNILGGGQRNLARIRVIVKS